MKVKNEACEEVPWLPIFNLGVWNTDNHNVLKQSLKLSLDMKGFL